MCDDRLIRRFAGAFVLLSVAIGWFVTPWAFLFTAFVGANLLQFGFTGLCPLEKVLGRFEALGCRRAARPRGA
ncbi:MAG TPA: DUF2892 domain-containing protein [Gemmatimonadaceae bacterium]|nr:DUF2892 domain-containing protein [Gemmatimonadaceae bacterium]